MTTAATRNAKYLQSAAAAVTSQVHARVDDFREKTEVKTEIEKLTESETPAHKHAHTRQLQQIAQFKETAVAAAAATVRLLTPFLLRRQISKLAKLNLLSTNLKTNLFLNAHLCG